MVVPKKQDFNNLSGAYVKLTRTIHNLCMQEMMKNHMEIMYARQWRN